MTFDEGCGNLLLHSQVRLFIFIVVVSVFFFLERKKSNWNSYALSFATSSWKSIVSLISLISVQEQHSWLSCYECSTTIGDWIVTKFYQKLGDNWGASGTNQMCEVWRRRENNAFERQANKTARRLTNWVNTWSDDVHARKNVAERVARSQPGKLPPPVVFAWGTKVVSECFISCSLSSPDPSLWAWPWDGTWSRDGR